MKKYLLFAVLAVSTMGTFVSCTNEDDQDELEILSPDKDKQECTGCDNNG